MYAWRLNELRDRYEFCSVEELNQFYNEHLSQSAPSGGRLLRDEWVEPFIASSLGRKAWNNGGAFDESRQVLADMGYAVERYPEMWLEITNKQLEYLAAGFQAPKVTGSRPYVIITVDGGVAEVYGIWPEDGVDVIIVDIDDEGRTDEDLVYISELLGEYLDDEDLPDEAREFIQARRDHINEIVQEYEEYEE